MELSLALIALATSDQDGWPTSAVPNTLSVPSGALVLASDDNAALLRVYAPVLSCSEEVIG